MPIAQAAGPLYLREGFALNSIRVRFIRGEEVKYVSHLDLMKVFERALRRANIPIAYSQGFNPHPQMVFGLPLSVGVTSEAEYLDLDLAEELSLERFLAMLNDSLPVGLLVTEAQYLSNKSNIMKEIAAASYDVLVSPGSNTGINELKEKFQELLAEPQINVVKEGKKGAREVDIKPMVHELKIKFLKTGESERVDFGNTSIIPDRSGIWVREYVDAAVSNNCMGRSYNAGNLFCISLLLSAGSAANLKPELLIQAMNEKYGSELKIVKIHRLGLYVNKEGSFIDPLDTLALA